MTTERFSSPLLRGIDEASTYYSRLWRSTGLPGLDGLVGGLAAGSLVRLTGHRELRRPILARVAGWLAGEGARVAYVSLLERMHVVVPRIVSMAARVPLAAVTDPDSTAYDRWHRELDDACRSLHLTVFGSDADLASPASRKVLQEEVIDLLVVDDASIDPRAVASALGVEEVLAGDRGLPGALAYFASRRSPAVLVADPSLSTLPDEPWSDVVAATLKVEHQAERDMQPSHASAVLHHIEWNLSTAVNVHEPSGLVEVDALANFPPPAFPQRGNVFSRLATRGRCPSLPEPTP